jgi:hypothetical protein
MTWPPENTTPTLEFPFYHTGNYEEGNTLLVSPEGLVYGETRRFARWPIAYWWDGADYREMIVEGQAQYFSNLPGGPRPFGEIWRVIDHVDSVGDNVWSYWYWDSIDNIFKAILWMYDVELLSELPRPGYRLGAAHFVIQRHVPVFWTGLQYEQEKHGNLEDNEPWKHLPSGFLRWMPADVRVSWVSPTEITLEAISGGSGQVWVDTEYVMAQTSCSVFNTLSTLEWNGQTKTLTPNTLQPNTEYWVYLANSLDSSFLIADWDYRGKLFLSTSSDVNGYLSSEGAGKTARLVGKIETDSDSEFKREINVSLISRTVSFPETFREYSDYRIEFMDHETLGMNLVNNRYGMIYVSGELYYLGRDQEISIYDGQLTWNDSVENKVEFNYSPAEADTLYYIYISSNIDSFNFNDINSATGRPWRPEDVNSQTFYNSSFDFRLRPFLSTKFPDNNTMSEVWPGYWTRLIGQVLTDANGRFMPAADVSNINQPMLNPTDFVGLAEIEIYSSNETEFQITRRKGTSGIVYISGEPILTYEQNNIQVHKIQTTDIVQLYTEADIFAPLSDLNSVISYAGSLLYVYMANSRSLWGDFAGKVFVSTTAPTNGYLSRNWPGNQARWIANLQLDAQGKFTGSFLPSSAATVPIMINDAGTSLSEVWSAGKVYSELAAMWAEVSLQHLYNLQRDNGVAALLLYSDSGHLLWRPIGSGDLTVVFSDYSTRTLPLAGISIPVSGSAYTMYYVYFPQGSGSIYLSTSGPNGTSGRLAYKGNDLLIGYVGMSSTNYIASDWGVYSYWNQQARSYAPGFGWGTTYLGIDGLIIPPGVSVSLSANGAASMSAHWGTGDQAPVCWSSTNLPGSYTCAGHGSGGYLTYYVYGNITGSLISGLSAGVHSWADSYMSVTYSTWTNPSGGASWAQDHSIWGQMVFNLAGS